MSSTNKGLGRTVSATGGGVAVGGDVSNSVIQTGDRDQAAQGVDVAAFVDLLEKLRAELREAPLADDVVRDLQAEVDDVKRHAERERPSGAMILGKLKTVTDVLASAAGAGEKLVPLARRLAEMAGPLFS